MGPLRPQGDSCKRRLLTQSREAAIARHLVPLSKVSPRRGRNSLPAVYSPGLAGAADRGVTLTAAGSGRAGRLGLGGRGGRGTLLAAAEVLQGAAVLEVDER